MLSDKVCWLSKQTQEFVFEKETRLSHCMNKVLQILAPCGNTDNLVRARNIFNAWEL